MKLIDIDNDINLEFMTVLLDRALDVTLEWTGRKYPAPHNTQNVSLIRVSLITRTMKILLTTYNSASLHASCDENRNTVLWRTRTAEEPFLLTTAPDCNASSSAIRFIYCLVFCCFMFSSSLFNVSRIWNSQ